MQDTIYQLVEEITPLDALEAEHQTSTLAWISSGTPLFRTQKPAIPPKHLVSYSVVVDPKKEKILLVDHKKARLWIPSGGHVDPQEHPSDTACRELQEELLVDLPLLHPNPLFITVLETLGIVTKHVDVSLWYVFRGDSSQIFDYDSKEFNGIQWFPFTKIPPGRSEPYLKRFINKLTSHLQ